MTEPNDEQLEHIAEALLREFGVVEPPVPIESMLQTSRSGLWEYLDVSQLSGTFMKFTHMYSPRMSLARMLARMLVTTEWGKTYGIAALFKDDEDDEAVYRFARMLVMPQTMMRDLSEAARTPSAISTRFEVPDEDARIRLQELDLL
ncbi:MAG: hypothetical protein OHK0046_01300 [Anaerolineae bacterium]